MGSFTYSVANLKFCVLISFALVGGHRRIWHILVRRSLKASGFILSKLFKIQKKLKKSKGEAVRKQLPTY